jgi:hypothetical protein
MLIFRGVTSLNKTERLLPGNFSASDSVSTELNFLILQMNFFVRRYSDEKPSSFYKFEQFRFKFENRVTQVPPIWLTTITKRLKDKNLEEY